MTQIVLESDLGIEAASQLHAQLLPLLASKKTVSIDGAAVGRLHGASLQVLAAFAAARAGAGRKTRLTDPAPALRDGARVLGLTSTLGFDP